MATSRRDQLQSYQFMVRRVVSALVQKETDPILSPFRKLAGAGMAGVMVAVIMSAGVGIYGLLRPGGNQSWRDGQSIIVEKETGAQYVLIDDVLHRVPNITSARLIMGGEAKIRLISASSLVDAPRGVEIGILDAPDSLPTPKRLLGAPWSLCSQETTNESGQPEVTSVLVVGERPGGGRDLGDDALLAVSADRYYLIWRNHRYPVASQRELTALALPTFRSLEVDPAWLDALPAGRRIEVPTVADAGKASTQVPGQAELKTGDVVVVRRPGDEQQYYSVDQDGLRILTDFEATLALSASGQAQPTELTAAQVDAANQVVRPGTETGTAEAYPQTAPEVTEVQDGSPGVCAAFSGADGFPTVLVDAAQVDKKNAAATPEQTSTGNRLTDFVVIRPGWGSVVESVASATTTPETGTLYLITDTGYRYPLADWEVLGRIGYYGTTPTRLLSTLVDRLPVGPALDAQIALRETGRP